MSLQDILMQRAMRGGQPTMGGGQAANPAGAMSMLGGMKPVPQAPPQPPPPMIDGGMEKMPQTVEGSGPGALMGGGAPVQKTPMNGPAAMAMMQRAGAMMGQAKPYDAGFGVPPKPAQPMPPMMGKPPVGPKPPMGAKPPMPGM